MRAILESATDPGTKALILLMRWSGLSCQDAACLPRAALDSQDRVHTIRRKTKTDVCVTVPGFVAEALRQLPDGEYFFWDGKSREYIVAKFLHALRKVFDAAKVYDGTSHRFRHTFSVEMLKSGTALEDVSRLLGHDSVATTQRYYSAWVKGRQDRLDEEVKKSWAAMDSGGGQ
jgi:integrase/recombinase XerD